MITRKNVVRSVLAACVFALLLAFSVSADEGGAKWVEKGGVSYAYSTVTGELLTNQKVGSYYTHKDGSRVLNEFRKKIYYDENGLEQPSFKGGFVKAFGKYYYFRNRKKVTGYRKISGNYYLFDNDGVRVSGIAATKKGYRYFRANGKAVRKKGWRTIKGKKYYLTSTGLIREGFIKVNKKIYYQTAATGRVTGSQTINGKLYYFTEKGVYSKKLTKAARKSGKKGKASDMLFFTKYESGSAGYRQVGGDNGNAYGKYQFDCRYSLLPFLKYCYNANPTYFKGFKKFAQMNLTTQAQLQKALRGNTTLYAAWRAAYDANPEYFSSMQDNFAIEKYYKEAERYLNNMGITMDNRTYVERGAVFSYAIQEGTLIAAKGVVAAKIKNTTSSVDFLTKLYDYRWKDPKGWNSESRFWYRYQHEKTDALAILSSIS